MLNNGQMSLIHTYILFSLELLKIFATNTGFKDLWRQLTFLLCGYNPVFVAKIIFKIEFARNFSFKVAHVGPTM